ncbi:rod-binding protein [Novosphingobium sp. YAF33]|uniref:rod-binding protein n=1 Tax=Novosphingobium sp. YAF33 TaxID=3233082 RepID=UPI003F9BB83B
MSTILSNLPGMAIKPGATDREKLAVTARQFEAVFVRQMLAEARKTHFGGEQLLGGQALDTFNQMQDEHFADVTAQSGVLGLARIIEQQMAQFVPPETTGAATGESSETTGKTTSQAASQTTSQTASHTPRGDGTGKDTK